MTRLHANPKLLVLLISVLALALLVACGSSATPEAAATAVPAATATVPTAAPAATTPPTAVAVAQPTGTLNIGYKELFNFDTHPRVTPATVGLFVGTSVGESLFARDAQRNALPKLVKEWSLSADNLVWTFKLQEGVPFHQGYGEMTAEDVIWNMQQRTA